MVALAIDHLIMCVDDLDGSAQRLLEEHGLGSVPGGRHPGHGTANRIVPLGDFYLELLAVVAPNDLAGSDLGQWVRARAVGDISVDAVCLRTEDLDEVCGRLGLNAVSMSRAKPEGSELRWRVAGLALAMEESLPFFIEWEVADEDLPGRAPLTHELDIHGVEVTMSGDAERLSDWVEGSEGINVESGEPGITSVKLHTDGGAVAL